MSARARVLATTVPSAAVRAIEGDTRRSRHNQVIGAVSSEHAEHGAGTGEKVLNDRDLMPVQHDRAGLLPTSWAGLPTGFAAPQDQQVGHHDCAAAF